MDIKLEFRLLLVDWIIVDWISSSNLCINYSTVWRSNSLPVATPSNCSSHPTTNQLNYQPFDNQHSDQPSAGKQLFWRPSAADSSHTTAWNNNKTGDIVHLTFNWLLIYSLSWLVGWIKSLSVCLLIWGEGTKSELN